MSEKRTFVLRLPEPWSVNVWMRKTHQSRNKKRNVLAKRIAEALPEGWAPIEKFRLRVEYSLFNLRDPLELGFSIKSEIDACTQAGLIADDGPNHMLEHSIEQRIARGATGVKLTFEEL